MVHSITLRRFNMGFADNLKQQQEFSQHKITIAEMFDGLDDEKVKALALTLSKVLVEVRRERGIKLRKGGGRPKKNLI